MLYGAFEVACVGSRPLKRALWWLGSLMIARTRAMSKSLIGEPRKRHEVRFDLPAQTAQVDHSISSPELIEGSTRLVGAGFPIELSEVGNDCNLDAIRHARPVGSLTVLLAG